MLKKALDHTRGCSCYSRDKFDEPQDASDAHHPQDLDDSENPIVICYGDRRPRRRTCLLRIFSQSASVWTREKQTDQIGMQIHEGPRDACHDIEPDASC